MANLVFTNNFRQLVRGILEKKEDCAISYDPQRLAGNMEWYVHGHPAFECVAHVRFLPEGGEDVKLTSPSGIVANPEITSTGTGSMLSGKFRTPADAEEVIVWFTLKDDKGVVHYDSNYGQNFHFRFTNDDIIEKISATVTNYVSDGLSRLNFTVLSSEKVREITIKYRVVNGSHPHEEKVIALSGSSNNGSLHWSADDIEVPFGSVIAYELNYKTGPTNNTFVADNNGRYFIAEVVKD